MNQTSRSNIKMPQISKSNLNALVSVSDTRDKLGWVVTHMEINYKCGTKNKIREIIWMRLSLFCNCIPERNACLRTRPLR
jgi:hypothetical protein